MIEKISLLKLLGRKTGEKWNLSLKVRRVFAKLQLPCFLPKVVRRIAILPDLGPKLASRPKQIRPSSIWQKAIFASIRSRLKFHIDHYDLASPVCCCLRLLSEMTTRSCDKLQRKMFRSLHRVFRGLISIPAHNVLDLLGSFCKIDNSRHSVVSYSFSLVHYIWILYSRIARMFCVSRFRSYHFVFNIVTAYCVWCFGFARVLYVFSFDFGCS